MKQVLFWMELEVWVYLRPAGAPRIRLLGTLSAPWSPAWKPSSPVSQKLNDWSSWRGSRTKEIASQYAALGLPPHHLSNLHSTEEIAYLMPHSALPLHQSFPMELFISENILPFKMMSVCMHVCVHWRVCWPCVFLMGSQPVLQRECQPTFSAYEYLSTHPSCCTPVI